MRILGMDLGSREVKIVIMENGHIIKSIKHSTIHFYKNCCQYNGQLEADLGKLGLDNVHFDICISTGYGRNNTDIKYFEPISEVKAHVWGAIFQSGLRDFVLLDLGGQDVKVARVKNGLILDLDLNEKCAASCGRFLENMAAVLDVDLNELYSYYENPESISSTCAVFSESELIGKVAAGVSLSSLCAGVNHSLYQRIWPMLSRYEGQFLLVSGGVARNKALVHHLNGHFSQVTVLNDPQFNGAIGCCHYGRRVLENKNHKEVEKRCIV